MGKPARRGLLAAGVQAAADAGGGLDIAMSHPLLGFLQTEALIQQEAAQRCPCGILPTSRKSPVQQGLLVIWQGFSSVSRPGNRAPKRSYGRRCYRNGKIPFGRAVSLSQKGHFLCKEEMSFLLCKSIAKNRMRHFLAPSGQPKMMRKNFMRSGFCP